MAFLWCSLSVNTCEIGISSGCRRHFFFHASSGSSQTLECKHCLHKGKCCKILEWPQSAGVILTTTKKKEKEKTVCRVQTASLLPHTVLPIQFLLGIYFFSNLRPEWECVNNRKRKRARPCCSHSTRLTLFTISYMQHNEAHLSSNILQIATTCPWLLECSWQTSVLFSLPKEKWSLSTVAFIMFRITASRGWIPCLHLSLGRTDKKRNRMEPEFHYYTWLSAVLCDHCGGWMDSGGVEKWIDEIFFAIEAPRRPNLI